MKKYSASLLAVPLAASMLLAGCGGDAKPDASSSSTPTSSPSTTSSPTTSAPPTTAGPTIDPNIPAAARARTPAGAEAFVRYFIERWNVAWTAPRAGILAPLCQPSALACTAFERDAARLVKASHRYDGDPVSVKFIGVSEMDTPKPNHLGVLADLMQERRSEVDAAGKVYVTDQRKRLRIHFDLLYVGQAWSVSSTAVLK